MKKAKSSSSSKRKERSKSPSDDSKSKRVKLCSKSTEKEKTREERKSVPRKTRWQAPDKEDTPKIAPIPETKQEKSGPPPRIKDFLHDKEKIVDLLFQTVTGAALQELIPDYLKKRSKDELRKLCLEQIKLMSDEVILQIISGKVDSSNKDEEKDVEKEQILKPEQPSPTKEKEEKKEVVQDTEKKPEQISKLDASVKLPSNASEPQTTVDKDMKSTSEEENLIPLVIKDEVAKDLILPERDAELLELEMRARAIRSLLKSKSQSANEDETKGDK